MTKMQRLCSWSRLACLGACLLWVTASAEAQAPPVSGATGKGQVSLPEPAPENESTQRRPLNRLRAVEAAGVHSNNVRAAGGPGTGTQAELSMAVSGSSIVITFNGGPSGSGYVTSTDGGRTFSAIASPPRPMGSNPCCDPAVAADNIGRFYFLDLYRNDGAGNCTNSLHVSTDGGRNFGGIVGSPFSYGAGTNFPDQPHLALDRVNQVGGNPQLYVFTRHFTSGINCPQTGGSGTIQGEVTCSINGGTTWAAPIVLAPFTDTAHMATGSDGSVYLVGNGNGTLMNTGSVLLRRSATSCNGGLAFGTPVTVADNQTYGGMTGLDREFPQPYVAVDKLNPNVAYVTWSADRLTNVNDRDILLARCVFSGTTGTCGAPVRVNDDAIGSGNSQYFPMLCVDPNNNIQMSWNDQRAGANSTALYHAEITPLGAAFSIGRNFLLSEVNFTPFNFGGAPDYGDYNENVEACDGQHYYAAWVSHVSPPGIMPASNDPDIFFTVVNNLQDIRVSGPLDFGDLCVGEAQVRKLEVFNIGDAPLRITNVSRVVGSPSITVEANPLVPLPLGGGTHTNFNIRCAPTGTGPQSAIIRVESDDPDQPQLNLTYTCNALTPRLTTLVADSGAFGTVCAGSFKDLELTLNNSGGCDLSVTGLTSSEPGEFQLPNVVAFPLVLHPGDAVQVPLRFAPTALGNRSALITITNSVPGQPPRTLTVSGVGGSPALATVIANAGNFGTVCEGSFKDLDLTLNNSGACALSISSLTSSSGEFISAGVMSFPLVIQPGDALHVPLRFQPTGTGNRNATLTINSNDPVNGSKTLNVSGVAGSPVIATIIADAGNFGDVCVGTFKDLALTLQNSGACALHVTSIASSSAEFQLAGVMSFPLVIAPGGALQIPLRFQPSSYGMKSATITINSDDPVNPSKAVSISGNVPSATIVTPAMLDFGKVCPGDTKNLTLTIGNSGGCDLLVKSITSDSPEFKVVGIVPFPLVVPPGSTRDVTIQFMPMSFGNKMATLTIMSNDLVTPNKTVAVKGIAPPPVIQVMPPALDFGKVCLGTSKDLPLTIKNAGECNLTVSSAVFSSPEFKLANPPAFPLVIPPGGMTTLTVRFSPVGATGPRAATLTINSDDPAMPVKVVPLNGLVPVSTIAVTGDFDFGMVAVGRFRDQVLNLSNPEPCDLLITLICEVTENGIPTTSADFNVISPVTYPRLVPGGTTMPVQIRFKPQRQGPRKAKLLVFGFDPQTSSLMLKVEYELKGVGK